LNGSRITKSITRRPATLGDEIGQDEERSGEKSRMKQVVQAGGQIIGLIQTGPAPALKP